MVKTIINSKILKYLLILGILLLPVACSPRNLGRIISNMDSRIVQIVAINYQNEQVNEVNIVGTGFIVNNDGYVITAANLLETDTLQTDHQKLVIMIPAPSFVRSNQKTSTQIYTNEFEIIAEDKIHDIALLKIKMDEVANPLNGKTELEVNYNNSISGTLNLAKISLRTNIKLNEVFAISGFPGNELLSQNIMGQISSIDKINLENIRLADATKSIAGDISDIYQLNVITNPAFTGGPIYSLEDGSILGMCANVFMNADNSQTTVMISSFYLSSFLKINSIDY